MNRHTLSALVPVALLAISSAAMAQDNDKTGFAIHAGIGTSVIRDEDGTETFRGSDFGYSFGFEYRFKRNFSLGMNVFDLGSPSDTFNSVDTEIEVRGIDLAARLFFGGTEKVEFYGLLGTANYYADLEPGGNNGLFGDDAFEFGAGVDIATNENVAIRIEGRFFDGSRDEYGGLLTVGFSFQF